MSLCSSQRERGAVLLVTLILLALITSIGIVGMTSTAFQTRMAGSLQNGTQVFAATMAALQRCEQHVRQHGSTAAGIADTNTREQFMNGFAKNGSGIGYADYFSPGEVVEGLSAQGSTTYQVACLIELNGPLDPAQIGGGLRRPLPVHHPVVYTVTARGARVPINTTTTRRPSVILQSRVVLRR